MIIKGRHIVSILPFFLFFALNTKAESEKQEAIFGIRYSKFSSEFLVFIEGDSLYLPFEEVLSFFKVYYKSDGGQRYEGYINNSDSSFVADFSSKEIQDIAGKKWTLNDNLWFATDLQIYVRTDLIARIFKLKAAQFFNKLEVLITADYTLPIKRNFLAEQRLNNFETSEDEEIMYPLLYDRSFTFLNGGIIDYSFGTSQNSENTNYNFSGNVGMEVLGGEFQYKIYGQSTNRETNYINNIRWRYLFDKSWLQNISIGNVQNLSFRYSGGRGFRKPTYRMKGVQITNENQKI